jgi:hypothetical protein
MNLGAPRRPSNKRCRPVDNECELRVWSQRDSLMRMPSEAFKTVSAGVMLRASMLGRMPRPLKIGAGLLTGGAIVALAHLVGADPRGLSGGPPGLLAGLIPTGSSEDL